MLRQVILLPTALALFATAVAASPPANAAVKPGPAFERLAGCWQIDGVVAGKPIKHLAKGGWRLDGNYFVYQEQSAPGEPAYQAVAFFGRRDDGKLVMHWLDTYGGQYSQTTGFGEEKADRIEVDTPYPDGPMHSVITWASTGASPAASAGEPTGGWRMRITEHPNGKPEQLFSDYRFSRVGCDEQRFSF